MKGLKIPQNRTLFGDHVQEKGTNKIIGTQTKLKTILTWHYPKYYVKLKKKKTE